MAVFLESQFLNKFLIFVIRIDLASFCMSSGHFVIKKKGGVYFFGQQLIIQILTLSFI